MKLNDHEQAMLDGNMGPARQRAMAQQLEIGRFFDAENMVEV